MEDRLDALEQYSRMDNVIINDFKPSFHSYSRAVTCDQSPENQEHAPETERVSLEKQVISYLNEKGVEISACHSLPSRGKPGEKPIVMRLISRKRKNYLLGNSKNCTPKLKTNLKASLHK